MDDATRTAAASAGDRSPTTTGVGASPPLGAGRVVAPLQYRDAERYEVLCEHGRGGIGRVQRAQDKELGRTVAIKELIRRGDIGEVRFLREALITARLEHPGIVPIHEAGRWPDGTPFYVMKLVAGRSLKELIEQCESVQERLELLHHVIAVADAVAYAHERGIIHRDLKPGNVIAGDFGETVVIDWGLAKDLHAIDDVQIDDGPYRTAPGGDLTVVGTVLGTPLYMSPEQGRGDPVDQRTDVYAIGSMLWQLCSLMSVPPNDLRQREQLLRASRIDPDLIAIITKALQPKPADRYCDAGELAADLKAFKSGARIAAREYSLFAMLAHWIRRRRMVALTVAVGAALALLGSVVYVRNIARERDRADAAAAHADTQRMIAANERDHARLAEASALLEKDPTRAQQVLDKLVIRTPQYALLRSRANLGAARRTMRVSGGIAKLFRHPVTSEFAYVSNMGELFLLDVDAGTQSMVDRDLQNAVTHAANGWMYARKPFEAKDATIATTTGSERVDIGALLIGDEGTLIAASGRTYALDHGALYEIESSGPRLVRRGVRDIAGSERVLMVCTSTGFLEVLRDGVVDRRTRCAQNLSLSGMAAAGANYAALVDSDTLLVVRGGKALRLTTHVAGEYALALASSGLLGMADFSAKPWFVRADGDRLELGPPHAARVVSVAVDDHVVAWGFEDGAVIALDTKTGQTWRFIGHGAPVFTLSVDARHARVLSAAREELRVWSLAPSPVEVLGHLPCLAFNAARSPDRTRIVLDCNDGSVREWSLANGALRVLHRHASIAYGLAWLGDAACSAGWDGRVLCTAGATTRELRPGGSRVRRIATSPHLDEVAIASDDGAVSISSGEELYRHSSYPYVIAFRSDGKRLASADFDGSVILYDMAARKILSRAAGHSGLVTAVVWSGGELWTTGMDGVIRRWREEAGKLIAIETVRKRGPVRFFRLLPDGWSATIAGRTLVVKRGSDELRLDLGRHIERCDVSTDNRYVAAGTASEVVVVDLERAAVAMLPLASRGGYVGFARTGFLTISDASRLVTVPLSSLEYIAYESNHQHHKTGE